MNLTREEYCCYDTAITQECWEATVKNESQFTRNVLEALSRLMIMNISALQIDRKAVTSAISDIEKSKPLKTTKQVLTEMGYLKSGESYQPWKLRKALMMAKSTEDKILIDRHQKYAENTKKLNLYKKLVTPSQNNSIIHDVMDFKYTVCNSGMNPITWRSNSTDLVDVLKHDSITIVGSNSLVEYFNVEVDDFIKFEMVWKEDIARNFELELSEPKSKVEEYIVDKYPHMEEMKFKIASESKNTMKFPWTDHQMIFSLASEQSIFTSIYDQSVCERVTDEFLKISQDSNERFLLLNNIIVNVGIKT